jgi:biopolymer transport protein TolQ
MAKAVPTTSIDGEVVAALPGVQTISSAPAHDMNMYSMFIEADFVVQGVILMLIGASFWSWTIFVDKFKTFRAIEKRMKAFEKSIWESASLEKQYESVKSNPNNPMARVFVAGMYEWTRLRGEREGDDTSQGSLKFGSPVPTRDEYARRAEIKERIWHSMDSVRNREVAALEHHLGFLATVGSAAPFIGLFGTVWGIMNAFQSIAATQNSTLAVVAPGIAEALFATAIGLFAAIPAVIFFNKFNNHAGLIAERVDEFADEFASVIARELDKG